MMKYTHTLVLIFVSTLVLSFTVLPVGDCEVLLEAIAGSYEGDCKKGQAHGNGKAVGVDTYEGAFKKGMPHGEGTYTWANGDVFTGTFKKGEKEGAGKMTKADGMVVEGYWLDDEYIGKEKNPYKVINRTNTVLRVSFKRLDKEPNKIDFKFSRQGKAVKGRNLSVIGASGTLINETDFVKTVQVSEFPFQSGVNFEAMVQRDEGGRGGGDYVSGNAEIRITQPGFWEVTFEVQPN